MSKALKIIHHLTQAHVHLFRLFIFVAFMICSLAFPLYAEEETAAPVETTTYEVTEQAGTYPIELTTYDEATQSYIKEIRYITVVFPRTVVSKAYKEAIDASDVVVYKDTLAKITDEELIKIAKARAWSTYDASPIPITKVEKKLKDKTNGIYAVSFSTAKDTTVTVHMMGSEQNELPVAITKLEQYFTYPEMIRELNQQTFKIGGLFVLLFIITILIYFYTNKNIDEAEDVLYDTIK